MAYCQLWLKKGNGRCIVIGFVPRLFQPIVSSNLFTVLFFTCVKVGIIPKHVVEVFTSREEGQSKCQQ
jgi:hypothetical protein